MKLIPMCIAILALTAPGFAQCQLTEDQALRDPNGQESDQFGTAVDISGDVVVVSSPGDDDAANNAGSVAVFRRQGSIWFFEQKVTASTPGQSDLFGHSIAVDGDVLAVGAFHADDPFTNSGSVYVYRFDGTSWNEEAELGATAANAYEFFGFAVDLAGDLLVVGALGDDTMASSAGALHVFRHNGTRWELESKLFESGLGLSDQFGYSVAADGDWIVGRRNFGTTLAVFQHLGGGLWVEAQSLVGSGAVASDMFGGALDMKGDLLVAGGADNDFAGESAGAAWVYRRAGTTWSEEQRLIGFDTGESDRFGSSVAIDGDTLVVGASGNEVSGKAHVFRFNGASWTEESRLTGTGGASQDFYGSSVAIENGTVVVGSPRHDCFGGAANCDAGATFAYEIGATSPGENCPRPYCFGDGGDQAGCSDCPCGNDETPTTRGGCTNDSGLGARLNVHGSLRVSDAALRLQVEAASPQTFGVLVSSDTRLPANPMHPCFGLDSGIHAMLAPLDGLRCVGGAQLRHGARSIDVDGSIGTGITPGWGEPDGPPGGVIAQGNYAAGQTRNWQVFYRSSIASQCGTGQNTTNGVSTTFEP